MADTTTSLAQFLYGRLPQIGGSGGSASGVLTVSTTSAATIADTNETDLWTYSLPANTLSADGRTLKITAFGDYGATANNKTVHLYFGGTALTSTTAVAGNSVGWVAQGIVIRSGASSQVGKAVMNAGTSTVVNPTTRSIAGDTTTALTIKVTGTNGTAAAGDIVFKGAIVEILN